MVALELSKIHFWEDCDHGIGDPECFSLNRDFTMYAKRLQLLQSCLTSY